MSQATFGSSSLLIVNESPMDFRYGFIIGPTSCVLRGHSEQVILLHNVELQMVSLVYALIIFHYEISLRRRITPMAPKAYCLCEINNRQDEE